MKQTPLPKNTKQKEKFRQAPEGKYIYIFFFAEQEWENGRPRSNGSYSEEGQNFLKDRKITKQFYEQRPKIQRICTVREEST
jgi:hypothetical protein